MVTTTETMTPLLQTTTTTTLAKKQTTEKSVQQTPVAWCLALSKTKKKRMANLGGATPRLPEEVEEGNVEYKLKLVDPTPERVEELMSQLTWRLAEGAGEAIYQIGVTDWGEPQGLDKKELNASLRTLRTMANALKLTMTVLLLRPGWRPDSQIAQVLMRRRPSEAAAIEVRVSMLGPVGSGKSTTVSVLTTGMSDNGHGLARMHVSRHKHELDNGLTTSVSSHVLGFDEKGGVTTHEDDMPSSVFLDDDWEETLQRTCKAVKFVDLAGHTKYLRSTLQGLTSLTPDYVMLTLAADHLVSVAGAVKRRQSMQENQLSEELEEATQEQVVGSLPDSCSDGSSSDSAGVGAAGSGSGVGGSDKETEDEDVDSEMELVRLCSRVRLARALGIPFFVVVTKMDTVSIDADFRGDNEDGDDNPDDGTDGADAAGLEDHLRERVHAVLDVLLDDAPDEQSVDVMLVQEGATDYLTAARAMRASHRRTGSVSPSMGSNKPKSVCVPLFCVSNVSGSNMDILRRFLNVLPVADERERARAQSTVFNVSTVFHDAHETAPIVAGLLTAGSITAGQDVFVGPVRPSNINDNGVVAEESEQPPVFVKARVASVHTSLSQQSARVCAGQSCTLALSLPESVYAGDVLRRGAVLLCAPPVAGQCVREFEVSVSDMVCFGSFKKISSASLVSKDKAQLAVRVNGRFMCHSNAVRQVVRVIKVDRDANGRVTTLRLGFEKHIEFMKPGTTCLLRNANVVVVANVKAIQ